MSNFQPNTLDEAVDHVLSHITDEESIKFLEQFENDERGFLGELHHFYGQNLRNNWYLWWFEDHGYESWPVEKPAIVQHFNDMEIWHADDMSSIILTSAYRKFFDRPLDLPSQIQRYHDHWMRSNGSIRPR